MMNQSPAKRSRAHFESGYFCAESVLLAVSEHAGITSDLIPGIATGFCGGMSRTDGTCGALSGAVLAINLLTGRNAPEETVDRNYRLVNRMIQTFQETFSTLRCTELIGCNLSIPEELERFQTENKIAQCMDIVEQTTVMVLDIIQKRTD